MPDSVRAGPPAERVETQKLADGVYVLGGASHNSVAVEFQDHIAVVEAPLSEARSLAVIEEIVRLIPNKPIRFLVNTHQHFDHIGGLRTYLHIGATIITHVKNYDFYNRDVLNYAPRTVMPDMVSRWPPTELTEGYNIETIRENYALTDARRTMKIYYVQPLQHAEGMLMAYLPTREAGDRSGPVRHASGPGARRVGGHAQPGQSGPRARDRVSTRRPDSRRGRPVERGAGRRREEAVVRSAATRRGGAPTR